MLQSGYAADFSLALTLESLNGLRNRSMSGGSAREADRDFVRVLRLMKELQAAGAVGLSVKESKDKDQTAVLFFQREDITDENRARAAEIRRLLKLPTEGHQFALTYTSARGGPGELGVNSRSMLQIMGAFSTYLKVPAADLEAKRALPAFEYGPSESPENRVDILSGKDRPENASSPSRRSRSLNPSTQGCRPVLDDSAV